MMEAPVDTTQSIILKRTIWTYTCIQPAALELPAIVSQLVQSLLLIIICRISAALAVSLEEKDIERIASIMGVESIFVISTCCITSFNNSFLVFAIDILSCYNTAKVND
jgi:hypothetical protein